MIAGHRSMRFLPVRCDFRRGERWRLEAVHDDHRNWPYNQPYFSFFLSAPQKFTSKHWTQTLRALCLPWNPLWVRRKARIAKEKADAEIVDGWSWNWGAHNVFIIDCTLLYNSMRKEQYSSYIMLSCAALFVHHRVWNKSAKAIWLFHDILLHIRSHRQLLSKLSHTCAAREMKSRINNV